VSTDPIVPPTGQFPIPPTTTTPFFSFRCGPAFKPYLASDASTSGLFLVDTPVTYTQNPDGTPITLSSSTNFSVTISLDGTTLAQGLVPFNASKFALPFSFTGLTPSLTPYQISCIATYAGGQTFNASAVLSYLPDPTTGSATKMDMRTGALLSRPLLSDGDYTPVFPMGFYTSLDPLYANLSIVNERAAQG
jgi:hypothetical protein